MAFDKNKAHLIPPAVFDIAEIVLNEKNSIQKNLYLQRLEVIRDYCEMIIKKAV